MEEKLKKKKRRTIALVVVAIVIVIAVIATMKFEYADYGKVLNEQVSEAENLMANAKTGNEEGQYAEYTLLDFKEKIDEAKKVSENKEAVYEDQKKMYENLKDDIKDFKNGSNDNCLSKEEASELKKKKSSKTIDQSLGKSKTLVWTVDGSKIEKSKTINFMAKSKGPYQGQIEKYVESLKLQGETVSFYHDGSFGGTLTASLPIYSEKDGKGYVYKFDEKKGTLTYVTEAKIQIVKDREKGSGEATAIFDVKSGGNYLVLLKKVKDSDGVVKKTVDKKDAEKAEEKEEEKKKTAEEATKEKNDNSSSSNDNKATDNKNTEDSKATADDKKETSSTSDKDKTQTSNKSESTSSSESSNKTEDATEKDNKLSVTFTIQNNTYSGHKSSIVSKMTYKFDKGATVYDVLYTICRNKNVQLEAEYTPSYGSYYVSGIDGLYEFDGGTGSGWIYKVNGSQPNYGCSEYVLKGGENIVWTYTCNYGKDV